ncbi:GMP synthase-like glutamine amidotransferase [Flavobacteriaceae bacterium MAR_2010_72]|nr:GMP synthase-like glutamine amidotransferase [Flavobacteriaceae bacterium MAR_2010_72]TVZ57687.1 GMP synthase-like glutamine amidotransferase [Flavobacteriaceae bacterium MAR_2010_105]
MAILDMNNNEPNQGLRCIVDIAQMFDKQLDYKVYDVRAKNDLPDTSYDIYISSGGPGSPLEQEDWRQPYLELVQQLWDFNTTSEYQKKYVFFICYSFQVVCDYFQLGEMKPRKSTSFGILPVHKTKAGIKDVLLEGLDDPFYAVDSRDWQLIQPRLKVFKEHGATILSLEKIRTHVEYERAIMAVRFSNEFVGTQFHPEADPVGMYAHFSQDVYKQKVITNFGEKKYNDMMQHMEDPDKITKTYTHILPRFIRSAIEQTSKQLIPQD